MQNATLIVMAAGIGSRYGKGIKQLDPVGPNGEIIVEYSVYDAMAAGFNKVIFVIRRELEQDFRERIGDRIARRVQVEYAFQEIDAIPEPYRSRFAGRKKPWGTGQAVLCCKDLVKEPFLVINADDYYGREAFEKAFAYLTAPRRQCDKTQICMVSFLLGNTLSENGGVTRGVCHVGPDDLLIDIAETHNIRREGDHAAAEEDGEVLRIGLEEKVSMNMWGMDVDFFDVLETGFAEFLGSLRENEEKKEYLLPTIISGLLQEERIEVKVLESEGHWFGITYKEDRDQVVEEIRELIDRGLYS